MSMTRGRVCRKIELGEMRVELAALVAKGQEGSNLREKSNAEIGN